MDKLKNGSLWVLGIGLLVRLALPFAIGGDIYKGDGAEYRFYAYNLEHYGVYSGEMGQPPRPGFDRMPGVPLLIYGMSRIVNPDSKWMLLPNVLAGWMILVLLVGFARQTGLTRNIHWWLLMAYACIPVVDYYSAQFYPEVPAAALGFLSFWFLFQFLRKPHWKWAMASGAAVAGAAWFRPEMSMLLLIPGLAALVHPIKINIKIKSALAVGLGFLAALSPWIVRNYANEKRFIPLGDNFLIERQDSLSDEQRGCSRGLYTWLNTWHYRERHVKTVAWDFMHTDLNTLPPSAFTSEKEKADIAALQTKPQYDCGSDRLLMKVARKRISQSPVRFYLTLPFQRIFFLLFRVERFDSLSTGKLPGPVITALWALFALFSNVFALFAFAGLVYWKKLPPVLRWMLAAAWMRLLFFAWFYHVEVRYMMVFFPVFFFGGMFLLNEWLKRKHPQVD